MILGHSAGTFIPASSDFARNSLQKKALSDVSLQATSALLALRAYDLTHGKLPPDLSALVPEFLGEVPRDAFDGGTLRYSLEKRIVYSVGQNLEDDGGDEGDSQADGRQQHQPDLVYPFGF